MANKERPSPAAGRRSGRRSRAAATLLVLAVGFAFLVEYPGDTDQPFTMQKADETREYYRRAYETSLQKGAPEAPSPAEGRYERAARQTAEMFGIETQIRQFVRDHGLSSRRVLEIGSGRGGLQDVASDYTGIDISTTVAQHYRKRFVAGSATALPFADNSFDGGWSIWVLEHVPNPEQALRELRRVMKNGAVFFLLPAWNCPTWAAKGYPVREFKELDAAGKLMKALIPLRLSEPYWLVTRLPARLIRQASAIGGAPTSLHYRRLTPNYDVYWMGDSDAVNSIDRHEAMLWFTTRGDECLNCGGLNGSAFMAVPSWRSNPLVVRIRK